jgi:hypothetical protein
MGFANRLVGYLVSFVSASLIYMVWFVLWNTAAGSHVGILFRIGIGIFFWLFGGMAAALVLITIPWYLAVILRGRLNRFGVVYFLPDWCCIDTCHRVRDRVTRSQATFC